MLDTRKIATNLRLSHWSMVLQDKKSSGLTTRAYCESSGIQENVYYYWQRKLREAAILAMADAPTNIFHEVPQPTPQSSAITDVVNQSDTTTKHPDWLLCGEPEAKSAAITIKIGNYHVEVCDSFNPDLLAQVCQTLVRLC